MRYFCTYFDVRYLTRGLALYTSLRKHCPEFHLDILCLDDACRECLSRLSLPASRTLSLSELETADNELLTAKPTRSTREYFFTLTPSLAYYLLQNTPQGEFLTYLDSDLYFYSDPEPLFEELKAGSIAIIPHRFPKGTEHMKNNGIYNVGWVGFRNDTYGQECASWWRQCCLAWCRDRVEGDRYADQGYLNDWPKRFPRTVVIRHLGANVAPWNVGQYTIVKKGAGLTVDASPLLFYHFHALHNITDTLFDSGLSKYGVELSDELRQLIYKPYLHELCAVHRMLHSSSRADSLACSSGQYSERCFDLVPRRGRLESKASSERAAVEAYLYEQLVRLERSRHELQAALLLERDRNDMMQERVMERHPIAQTRDSMLNTNDLPASEASDLRSVLSVLRKSNHYLRRQSALEFMSRNFRIYQRFHRKRLTRSLRGRFAFLPTLFGKLRALIRNT
jgi:hypothetical protein